MDNPSMQKFYHLINRNRNKGVSTNTLLINHNGKEVFEPKDQVKCFAQYMEDLFIPKDNEYDNNYQQLSNIRIESIESIYRYSNAKPTFQPFTSEEIHSAIGHLNSGKAMDEFGIFAEHLQKAKAILTPIIS
jgi:hypothetical protein